jgi:hypothetical protein
LKIADDLLATPVSAPVWLPCIVIDIKGDADVVRHSRRSRPRPDTDAPRDR